jgi:hypothetical protein
VTGKEPIFSRGGVKADGAAPGLEAFHKSRTYELDVQLDEVLEEAFSTSDLFMREGNLAGAGAHAYKLA